MQLPPLICLLDHDGHVIEANAAAASWGFALPSASNGKTPHELLHSGCTSNHCTVHRKWNQLWHRLRYGASQSFDLTDSRLNRRLRLSAERLGAAAHHAQGEADQYAVVRISDMGEATQNPAPGIPPDAAGNDAVAAAVRCERSRIEAELHDGVCQRLALMKLQVERQLVMARGGTASSDDPEFLERLITGLRETIGEVRALTREAPDVESVRGDIFRCLGSLCGEMDRVSGHARSVTFSTDITEADLPPGVIDHERKLAIYRIAQESLRNAVQHAQASVITVSLTKESRGANAGALWLTIEDNGRGFEAGNRPTSGSGGGLGLYSMRRRAEGTGGQFFVRSTSGEGTRLSACWSFPESGARALFV